MRKLLFLFCVVTAVLTTAPSWAELRLLGVYDGRAVPVTSMENSRVIGLDGDHKVVFPKDSTYKLEGDLKADYAKVKWTPPYSITLNPTSGKLTKPDSVAIGLIHVRHLVELEGKKLPSGLLEIWSEKKVNEGGIAVLAWLVKGRITQVDLERVPPVKTTKFFVVTHDFELTAAETEGQGIMLLWVNGQFVEPDPQFPDARSQQAMAAMLLGDLGPLQSAVAGGMKASIRGKDDATLLHVAAEAGLVDAVDFLLTHGVKANALMASEGNAICPAAEKGRLAVIERLLVEKPPLYRSQRLDQTALHSAVSRGHQAVAKILIEHGADVDAVNDQHESPFSLAIDKGYADLAEAMLKHGATWNGDLSQNQRVFFTQAAEGHTAMVRLMLKQKMDPRVAQGGQLVLGAASRHGDRQMVEALVAAGAQVNAFDSAGHTALMIACSVGSVEFVQALLDAGADVNLLSKDGKNCLFFAAARSEPDLIERLVAKGADPLVRNQEQFSPLDFALLNGARAAATVFNAHGASIDLKSPRAPDLLEKALTLNVVGVIRTALADGWAPNSKFQGNWPALLVAKACGANDCVAVLEKAGAIITTDLPPLVSAREIDATPKLTAVLVPDDPRDPDGYFPATIVVVTVILDGEGRVHFPVVNHSDNLALSVGATQAVAQWRFSPVTRGGKPVCVRLGVPVEFPASSERAINWTKAERLPLPIKRVNPEYPYLLSRSKKVGRVLLAFTVGVDGKVREVRVENSTDPAFADPAREAISHWIFEPGMLAGKTVAVRMEQEIVFSLQ